MASTVEELIATVGELPAMPAVAHRVSELVRDPKVSAADLEKVIETDPALAGRILRIANSAFYGGYRSVSTIQAAVMRMGFDAVRGLVVAASVKGVYRRFGLTEQQLWEHAVGVGIGSRIVAKEAGINPDEAFVAGLLHDVGKTVLANNHADRYAEVFRAVYNDGMPSLAAEVGVFGFGHTEIGGSVVRRWRLPESIEECVRHHHQPLGADPAFRGLAAVVAVANMMAHANGIGVREAETVPDLYEGGAASMIRLSPDRIPVLRDQALEAYNAEREVFA